ncbi:MAG: hypothetical protein HYW37_00405 [Candidatus Colwellbacteria bacterium]|nr:hypothetical protein [Candidatus Colwellbacteria bacterium]
MRALKIVAANLVVIYVFCLAVLFLYSLVSKFIFGNDFGLPYQPAAFVAIGLYALEVLDRLMTRYVEKPKDKSYRGLV